MNATLDKDLTVIETVTVNGIMVELVKDNSDVFGLPYILRTFPRIMTENDSCCFGQYHVAKKHFYKMVKKVSPNMEK